MSNSSVGFRRRIARNVAQSQHAFTTEEDTGLDTDEFGDAPTVKVKGHWFRKMVVRSCTALVMMVSYAAVLYLGHVYVCLLVFALECFVFKELVGVRQRMAAERRLPLFRSLQWAWFLVACFASWSSNVCDYVLRSPAKFMKRWSAISRVVLEYNMWISFSLYTVLMMGSVLSLRKGLYKYQIAQYTWTVLTICIIVLQLSGVFHIVYAGLIWWVLSTTLVICNDSMAYFIGQAIGRKVINRPFLEISPNKTWEGFLGSAVCTMAFAFWFAGKLATKQWMICEPEDLTFSLAPLECSPSHVFKPTPFRETLVEGPFLWMQGFTLLAARFAPNTLGRVLEWEICSVQLHALALGFFASFAAPFGGFLSSAIKRAYGIKDYHTIIPGHGGVMDRFDCQFVMVQCTFVHHRTFVRGMASITSIMTMISQLPPEEQQEVLQKLQAFLGEKLG